MLVWNVQEFVEHLPETSRQSESELRQSEMQQYLQALTKGKLNEEKLNQAYMKQRSGTPLRYGDTIQVRVDFANMQEQQQPCHGVRHTRMCPSRCVSRSCCT